MLKTMRAKQCFPSARRRVKGILQSRQVTTKKKNFYYAHSDFHCGLLKQPFQAETLRWHSISASNHSTTKSFATDPYDEYRQTEVSAHILGELQLETMHTNRRLDQGLYENLLEEVQIAWALQSSIPPEQGPTGTWQYHMSIDEATGNRLYQRNWKGDEQTTKTILELEPECEMLSMSLSVDESCIACLVENVQDGRREVRLFNNESDRQNTFPSGGEGFGPLVGLEWGPVQLDGDHLLYLVGADEQGRSDRILVSQVNPTVLDATAPELLIQSDDPSEIVDVQRTKGCQYVAIQIMTKTSNEIYLSSGPEVLELVQPRQENIVYHLEVGERGEIVMLFSENGGEYRLREAHVSSLPLDPNENPYNPTTETRSHVIMDMDLFRDYLVLYENSRKTGISQLTIRHHGSPEATHSVSTPLAASDHPCVKVSPVGNIFFGASRLRCMIESPVTPGSLHEVDLSTSAMHPVDPVAPPLGTQYKQERVLVQSHDGTEVPLSLIYRKTEDPFSWWKWFAPSEEPRPVVLTGYGSYGESVNLGYDPTLIPLIERGYVLAFAHTRGGGELGKAWYHAGRHERKSNAVDDFQACAHYLKSRWKGPITAKGFSAAGVIVGAVMNRQPDLFENVVLTNAFLDVHATLSNPNLFLTPHEWDEFGNPLKDAYTDSVIRSYCPVTNVADSTENYPRCLLIGTLDDKNTPFWNAAIFAKKIRQRNEGNKDKIFLHIQESGGHQLGQSRLQVAAMELTFILQGSSTGPGSN